MTIGKTRPTLSYVGFSLRKKKYGDYIFVKYKKTHSMDLEDSVQLQNLDDLLDDINDLN